MAAPDADVVIVGAGSAGCLLANRLSADPALRVTLIEAGPHWLRRPRRLRAAARARGSAVYHRCRSARMGPDRDAMAVLDPELRVRGVERLRLAEASAFPAITSASTNATAYRLAEKASDLIAGHLSS